MEGVKQVAKHPELGNEARFCFVKPPDMDVLERRLRGRGTDAEEQVQKRLAQARKETEFSEGEGKAIFEMVFINDDLDATYEIVKGWVLEG